jgi:aspartate aminotransferase
LNEQIRSFQIVTDSFLRLSSPVPSRLSALSTDLRGSSIMQIAGEVNAMIASGKSVANLTVGDFDPRQFRIPRALEDAIVDALRAGESNYPAPAGIASLREAVRDFYKERGGLDFSVDNIVMCTGTRPAIYALYRALVDEGDRVVYGVPSWNNYYYVQMVGAEGIQVPCDATTNFLPTAAMLRPHIRGARLLALNSPLNPTGTLFDAETLGEICDMVLEENARRGPSERPLFVMYDQVYWMLTFGGAKHVNPIALRPEMAKYTVLVDGISKNFAATGLRVGWAVAPTDVMRAMNDVIGHIGAWAPRAEQVATARVLADRAVVDAYMKTMCNEAASRLTALYEGISSLKADGLPVDAVKPEAAIYLTARFALHGMRTEDGRELRTDDDVRRYLLEAAGLGAIQFVVFGAQGDSGWFRLSIGVISVEQINALIPRLRTAIEALAPALVS